jgi:predicted 2-oxoglutarate/Fe(II)-dependent dioxygenase YbiX
MRRLRRSFCADADSYDGGDLVIESPSGEEAFKPPAGSLVAYPSTTLHRVEPVTRGRRIAAVGWARSLIRSAEQRELLFDLDRAPPVRARRALARVRPAVEDPRQSAGRLRSALEKVSERHPDFVEWTEFGHQAV